MNTQKTENLEKSEKDALELVLNEFTAEHKKLTDEIIKLKETITSLETRTENLEMKLDNITVTAPPVDTGSVQTIVTNGICDMKKIIADQPKNIQQNKRFLLFPEHNAKEYYSVVLRWLLYIIIATYCYLLLKYMANHWVI